LALEDGTDKLFRNVGILTTNLGCVTSQKTVYLICKAVKAWNHLSSFAV